MEARRMELAVPTFRGPIRKTFEDTAMDLMEEIDRLAHWSEMGSRSLAFDAESNAGFLICDRQGRVVLAGKDAAELFHIDQSELRGRPIAGLLADSSPKGLDFLGHRPLSDLDDLSTKDGWRMFQAIPSRGREFPVAVSVNRFEVDALPLYVFRLCTLSEY